MELILIVAFGLVAGSFLALCAYRLPRGMSLARPGSHCTACQHPLAAAENLPLLAYAWQRGRCRNCGIRIGWHYPALEAATAACFAWSWVRSGSGTEFVREAFFLACLLALMLTDWECRQLPDEITLGGWAAGLGFAAWARPAPGMGAPSFASAAWASAIGAGGLALLSLAYQGWRGRAGMGWGDIKMLGMMGAFLGVGSGAVGLALAAVAASVAGIGQAGWVLTSRLRRGQSWGRARAATGAYLTRAALPFGIFLAAGAMAALAWGVPLWRAWLGLGGAG
ncbi:MAG: prepilin peptidase [Terriglobales bacterium]